MRKKNGGIGGGWERVVTYSDIYIEIYRDCKCAHRRLNNWYFSFFGFCFPNSVLLNIAIVFLVNQARSSKQLKHIRIGLCSFPFRNRSIEALKDIMFVANVWVWSLALAVCTIRRKAYCFFFVWLR